jgi:hypothetical protein
MHTTIFGHKTNILKEGKTISNKFSFQGIEIDVI